MHKFLSQLRLACERGNIAAKEVELEVRAGPFSALDKWNDICVALDQMGAKVATINDFSISDADPMHKTGPRANLISRRDVAGGPVTNMRKTKHGSYVISAAFPLRIAWSREELIGGSGWSIPPDALMRLRARKSARIGDWKIEVTRVANTTVSAWRANRAKYLPFYDGADVGLDAHIEIEAEYAGTNVCAMIRDPEFEREIERAIEIIGKLVAIIGATRDDLRANIVRFIGGLRRNSRVGARLLKEVLNNAFSITRNTYLRKYWPFSGYWVTDKADGERAVAIIDSDNHILIVSDSHIWFASEDRAIVRANDIVRGIRTILDGEVIVRKDDEGRENITLLAFDCLYAHGKSVCDKPFSERKGELMSDLDDGIIHIRAKDFFKIGSEFDADVMSDIIGEVMTPSVARDYDTDGLIFTQDDRNYFATKNVKWKPMERNTIDFYLVRAPEEDRAKYAPRDGRDNIYLLYVACSDEQRRTYCISSRAYDPAGMALFECRLMPGVYVFASDRSDLGGKVCEMIWNRDDGWRMLGERADRVIGNNIKIATDVFANYIDPFPLEALWKPGDQYFEKDSDSRDRASNKFRRFVVTVGMWREFGAHLPIDRAGLTIVDMGGGRAQDYARFALLGASCIINLDADAGAIIESVSRINAIQEGALHGHADTLAERWLSAIGVENIGARKNRSNGCDWPTYFGQVLDFTRASMDEISECIAKCCAAVGRKVGVHVANFTFSFHYLCVDQSAVIRMFNLLERIMTSDGMIVITTMNGKRVRALLRANGGTEWIAKNADGTNRYVIRCKDGKCDKRDFGSMVEVSVPFARELYVEPLCIFEAVDEIAARHGFTLASVIEHDATQLAQFARASPDFAANLDDLDAQYSALFDTRFYVRGDTPIVRDISRKK